MVLNPGIMRSTLLASLTLVGMAAVYAGPIGPSVTISDANFSGSNTAGNWYANREDNETETNPNTIIAQVWDLEGMYLSGYALTMVGGFDFRNGTLHGGHTYKAGDIFFDVNGDAVYGQAANGGSGVIPFGSTATTANTFGYDYVLSFNAAMTHYSVFSLTSASQVVKVTDVPSSNPWRYASGGTAVAGHQNVAIGSGYGLLSPADAASLTSYNSLAAGLQGDGSGNNNHYYLTVDVSFLPANTLTLAHNTIQCGNDNLLGQFNVPDAGTTSLLVMSALAGMVAVRRRFARR